MKWFKHDADASNDAKLKKLRLKYGAQGYGIYWYCLELIARNVEKHNLTFELEHDAELIADDFKLSADLVQHIMTFMIDLGLFENTDGIITCLKMANRTDEYTQQLMRSIKSTPDNIPIISKIVPIISEVIEEKRVEEKRVKSLGATATRLPADWKPSNEEIEFCRIERPDLNVNEVKKRFVDYWVAIGGAKGRKLDWAATWRNWVRNERNVPTQKQNSQPSVVVI